ncbi:MAG: hypothetical protein AAGE59_34270 [Cyanobacteria bacterium P01_F01_bin.86]
MQKFKPAGLVFGSFLLLVPGYAIYHHTGLSQQAYVADTQKAAHLDWARAQSSPVSSEEALARANTCIIGRNTDMSPAITVFNRDFSFNTPEDVAVNEGRFFCALDGSSIQIIGGKAMKPVRVDPSDLNTYHQILIDQHNVDVTHILKFMEGKENNNDHN